MASTQANAPLCWWRAMLASRRGRHCASRPERAFRKPLRGVFEGRHGGAARPFHCWHRYRRHHPRRSRSGDDRIRRRPRHGGGFSLTTAQLDGFRKFVEDRFSAQARRWPRPTILPGCGVVTGRRQCGAGEENRPGRAYGAGNAERCWRCRMCGWPMPMCGSSHVKLSWAGAAGRCWTPLPFGRGHASGVTGCWRHAASLSSVVGRLRRDDWNDGCGLQLEIEDAAPASA